MIRKLAFRALKFVFRHLHGKRVDLGRLRLVRKTFDFLSGLLITDHVVSVDVRGQRMYITPHDSLLGRVLLFGGTWEAYQVNLFEETLSEGMVVVDIGANIGYYTLVAAARVGERGKVYAFEPEPSNYALLLKNIGANGYNNVLAVRKAVTNRTGTINLFLSGDTGEHSIGNDNQARRAIVVDSVSLDEFFRGNEYPVHVIKMDIEGAEMVALEGMVNIVTRNPGLKIFTEFCPEALEKAGFSPIAYLDRLREHGFELYLINGQRQRLEMVEIPHLVRMCRSTKSVNLLCQRPT